MICVEANFPPASARARPRMCERTFTLSFADGAAEVLQVQGQILYCLIYMSRRASRFMQ